ncbi:unnamed protein product [Brassicogethes aeneus]|uniref:Uncharacterized protein n=1 Tax=Brassicogethes aeneus TaxID=1431903 RepID=A0A9P0AT68_BRAAE|nr:unnamed protein product [Brassicogethes aeneus]
MKVSTWNIAITSKPYKLFFYQFTLFFQMMNSTIGNLIQLTTTMLPNIVGSIDRVSFSWYDYALFVFMLGLSACIGIYFGCFGNKQATAKEYLMGGKKMAVVPIALSLVASHVSGLSLLGIPADVYVFGACIGLQIVVVIIGYFINVYVYLPVFYKLQFISLFEYLEKRFDSRTRSFASFLFTLGILLYLPIVIYIPALALSAATEVNIHYITPVVCGVCVFYTTIGGLKAVVWTDAIQFTITIGSLITVYYLGLNAAGGFSNVWTEAYKGKRLTFPIGLDITERDSILAVIIGSLFWFIQFSAVHQTCVQKFLSVSSFSKAKITVLLFSVGMSLVLFFTVSMGLIMYTRYKDCDPHTQGYIEKIDQMLPYYVLDVAGSIPGLPGLFIAGIFCAALSTLSATLNCLSGTIYEDFIAKYLPVHTEKTTSNILKLIVIITGVVSTVSVYAIEKFGSVLPIAYTFNGVTGGPTLALFTLGVLFPKVKGRGAFYGSLIGLLVMSIVAFGTQYYKSNNLIVLPTKPVSIEGCYNNFSENLFDMMTTTSFDLNITTEAIINTKTTQDEATTNVFLLFRISHYYYTFLGCLCTMIPAIILSYFCKEKNLPLNKDLISPLVHFLLTDDDVSLKDIPYYDVQKALKIKVQQEEDLC